MNYKFTNYKYAGADFTFPLLSHINALKVVKLLEFDGVDIGLFQDRTHLQPSTVLVNAEKSGRELLEKVVDTGLEIADVFLQCHLDFDKKAINHPCDDVRAEVRNAFEKTVEYALSCKSKHVTILPGVHFEGEDYETSFKRTQEELLWRLEKAQKVGLILAVEPHIGSIIDTPNKALRLAQETKGLTLTVDYTHFAKVGIADTEVEPLLQYASHFHGRGAKKGMLQCVLEDNTINYPNVIKAMKKYNYKGYVGIEYIWTAWEDCNKSDNISECILLKKLLKEAESSI